MKLEKRFEIWTMETLEILADEARLEESEESNKYYNPDLEEEVF